jgi:hypothetical protein
MKSQRIVVPGESLDYTYTYPESNQDPFGAQGPQGVQGTQGLQGTAGTQGTQGVQGVQGSGVQGTQGNQGTQGFQGEVGTQGTVGAQGATGSQGATGAQGTQGTQGVQGATGSGTWILVKPSGSDTATTTLTSAGMTFTIDGTVQKQVSFRAVLNVQINENDNFWIKFTASTANSGRIYERGTSRVLIKNTLTSAVFANDTAFVAAGDANAFFNTTQTIGVYQASGRSTFLEYNGNFFVDTGSVTFDVLFAGATVAGSLWGSSYLEYYIV